jgi:hypothetical protein
MTANEVVEHFILQENRAYPIIKAARLMPHKIGYLVNSGLRSSGRLKTSRQQDPVAPLKGVEKLRAPRRVMLVQTD